KASVRLDLGLHAFHAAAGKALAAFLIGDRKTGLGEPVAQDRVGGRFGIDEHAVAVEDDEGREHHSVPVEPNPPSPRSVAPARLRSSMRAWVTGAMTSCAMRMPRSMAKS